MFFYLRKLPKSTVALCAAVYSLVRDFSMLVVIDLESLNLFAANLNRDMSEPELPVEEYLAQRGRMKLLDAVLHVDGQGAEASSLVTEHWPLFEAGSVSPLVIVELVAQTAGVSIRWLEMQGSGGRDKGGAGLIVGIKEAVFHVSSIQVQSQIITWAGKRHAYGSYSEFQGHCKVGEQILGEATIQVLRTE